MIKQLDLSYIRDPYPPHNGPPQFRMRLRVVHERGSEELHETFTVWDDALEDLLSYLMEKGQRDFRKAWKDLKEGRPGSGAQPTSS